jgi:branched-chain amino acid transport system permease protein
LHQLAQFVISGVVLGGTYALASVGLALIFGVMRVVNFGQADFMMLSMYVTLAIWSFTHLEPIVALAVVALLFFALGWLFHRLALSRVTGRRQAHDAQIVLTLGAGIVLEAVALIVWGGDPRVIRTSFSAGSFALGGLFVDRARAYAFLFALLLSLLLYVLLQRTSLGRSLRAAAEDWEASAYVGIDVRAMHGVAFALGIAMTAMAGVLLTTFRPFTPFIGQEFIVLMFVAVVLGGLGSVMGALAGGLVVGVVEVVSQLFLPSTLAPVVVFVIFLLVLYLRPQGLFGRRLREF